MSAGHPQQGKGLPEQIRPWTQSQHFNEQHHETPDWTRKVHMSEQHYETPDWASTIYLNESGYPINKSFKKD
jgi:hypothetical protein